MSDMKGKGHEKYLNYQFDAGYKAGFETKLSSCYNYLIAELNKEGFNQAADYLRIRCEQLQQD